jgi:hypothetical protein
LIKRIRFTGLKKLKLKKAEYSITDKKNMKNLLKMEKHSGPFPVKLSAAA